MFVEINSIKKSYGEGETYAQVLKGISTTIAQGSICVIMGPSGSGKSTLLNVIGGLERVDSGTISVDGVTVTDLGSEDLINYRREKLGFVFQFYNLIPNLTVRENIQTCEYLNPEPLDMEMLLDVLDLKAHTKKFPAQLSGGQQQRCSIARALIKNPQLLLCDEPTGALDYKNSKEILLLLERLNQEFLTTILLITHNEALRRMAHQVLVIKDGQAVEQGGNESRLPVKDLNW
ncbi:MAG: ABC transporter ATP-binding protein [Clostridiales Family XIII bacterium]|jgi:putative ABC transport system ATP-binding protein|nr:ABC transporter ATP-binding protein [Clostridiales Family XIII bacterium]